MHERIAYDAMSNHRSVLQKCLFRSSKRESTVSLYSIENEYEQREDGVVTG
jgi:hypothetical protein